jgi:hypothetical protein
VREICFLTQPGRTDLPMPAIRLLSPKIAGTKTEKGDSKPPMDRKAHIGFRDGRKLGKSPVVDGVGGSGESRGEREGHSLIACGGCLLAK